MTKLDKLTAALEGVPGAGEVGVPGLSCLLASSLTQPQVDQIAWLLRAARKAGRQDERDARKRRRGSRRRDPGQMAGDTERVVRSGLGRRAAIDLDALAALQAHYDGGAAVLAMAVDSLRDTYSDTEIGVALGITRGYARQEVRRRFGSRATGHEEGA